jgi:hypothetical protein
MDALAVAEEDAELGAVTFALLYVRMAPHAGLAQDSRSSGFSQPH